MPINNSTDKLPPRKKAKRVLVRPADRLDFVNWALIFKNWHGEYYAKELVAEYLAGPYVHTCPQYMGKGATEMCALSEMEQTFLTNPRVREYVAQRGEEWEAYKERLRREFRAKRGGHVMTIEEVE